MGSKKTDALVVIAIVASGIVISALLQPSDPATTMAGCDSVETAGDIQRINFAFTNGTGNHSWFDGARATAMSAALADLLPPSLALDYAPPENSLVFQPIPEYASTSEAVGTVSDGDASGTLSVSVTDIDGPLPPCTEGFVDERRTLPDGTVVDIRDLGQDPFGTSRLRADATAFTTDGSQIRATVTAREERVPVDIDALVAISTDPRLRVTAPVPPGLLAPMPDCTYGIENSDATVSRETAERLNAALAEVPVAPTVLERPLASLQLAYFNRGQLCETIAVPGTDTMLTVAISDRRIEGPDDPAFTYTSRTTDGIVVDTGTAGSSTVVQSHKPDGTVVLARTDGTAVPTDLLDAIALAPGLTL